MLRKISVSYNETSSILAEKLAFLAFGLTIARLGLHLFLWMTGFSGLSYMSVVFEVLWPLVILMLLPPFGWILGNIFAELRGDYRFDVEESRYLAVGNLAGQAFAVIYLPSALLKVLA